MTKQRQIHNNKVYEYDQYSYSAEDDYQIFLRNRQNSGRRPKCLVCDSLIYWSDDKMLNDGWAPDIVVGRAKNDSVFSSKLILCTSSLYHWIDRGIIQTKNIELIERVARKPRNDSKTHREIARYSVF